MPSCSMLRPLSAGEYSLTVVLNHATYFSLSCPVVLTFPQLLLYLLMKLDSLRERLTGNIHVHVHVHVHVNVHVHMHVHMYLHCTNCTVTKTQILLYDFFLSFSYPVFPSQLDSALFPPTSPTSSGGKGIRPNLSQHCITSVQSGSPMVARRTAAEKKKDNLVKKK